MQTLNLDAYPTETTFGFPEAQIISLTNTGSYPITYNFDAGVTSSGNVTLQPGQSSNDTRSCTNLHLISSNGIQSLQVTMSFELSHQIGTLSGSNTHSLQTTYTNGNLTQAKELDVNNNTISETDVTYNADGSVNTITEIFNGKTMTTTLNYVNGSLSSTNPFTRSVS